MNVKKIRGALRHIIVHPDQSNRVIGEQRSCSPTTVGRYRRLLAERSLDSDDFDAMTDTDIARFVGRTGPQTCIFADADWSRDLRDLHGDDTRADLHERYVAESGDRPTMSYRTYCKRIEARLAVVDPTMRLVHRAGEAMMVDFAGYKPKGLISGEVAELALFVAILPASQYMFACVVASQKVPD